MKNSLKTLTNIIIELIKKYKGDWKENNPSSPNYIKNKPFYSIKEIKTVVNVKKTDIPEDEPLFNFKYFDIVEDNVYTIIFNGETYECKPRIWYYDTGLEYIMGNFALDDYGADTGEPFLIRGFKEGDYSDALIYFPSEEPITEVELEIMGEVETIQKIDDKFLPQGIGKKGDGKNSEIFNDYSLNYASGGYSHVEGYGNKVWGDYSHIEGSANNCSSDCSHMEGYAGSCYGDYSHVEGAYCYAGYPYCHAEGYDTSASAEASHSEGYRTQANGNYSHAEGYRSNARGKSSHSEGSDTNAFGDCSHAEGNSLNNTNSINITKNSTISDIYNKWSSYKFSLAKGLCSHVEGYNCMALNSYSHAEGQCTVAGGNNSHTEGYNTHAIGNYAHAEGYSNNTSNYLGYSITDFLNKWSTSPFALAYGRASHVEGDSCLAMKECSHGEGYRTQAIGDYSHAEGNNTVAGSECQHVEGKYNKKDNDNKYVHIIGNGTDVTDELRSNAHTLDWNGNAWYQGNVFVGGTEKEDAEKLLSTADIYFDENGYLVVTVRGMTKRFQPVDM